MLASTLPLMGLLLAPLLAFALGAVLVNHMQKKSGLALDNRALPQQ